MARINNKETKKATQLYKKGYSIKDIAKKMKRDRATITKILVKAGVHKINFRLTPEERNEIIELLLIGTTLTEVAKLFEIERVYVRDLVYRASNTYGISNDRLVIKTATSREQQIEPSTEHELINKTASLSGKGKEKDYIITILLDALIKSEEGSEILRRKGIGPVMKEIESTVDSIIN